MKNKVIIHDFEQIGLSPVIGKSNYVFISLPNPGIDLMNVALATFREREGVSLVIEKLEADQRGIPYELVFQLITIGIYSSLAATGLTAKISQALAQEQIPCNIIAAFHHDHLLIPENLVLKAVNILESL